MWLDDPAASAPRALLSIFLTEDTEGDPLFDAGELRGFLPLLFLSVVKALGWNGAPASVRNALEMFAQEIGFAGGDAAALTAAIDAHYRANPPNVHLARAFGTFVSEQSRTAAADKSMAELAGEKRAAPSAAPPPEGSIPAGPLAAHTLHKGGSR